MFLTLRLLLSFWFRSMVLAGYLEPLHSGRGTRGSQAWGKADFSSRNALYAPGQLFERMSSFADPLSRI
jgi:hypothetical protein